MFALWRRHPILTLAFGVAVALSVFFATRLVGRMIYWSDPTHQNQSIEGWMTPFYIARSWGVDPAALGLPLTHGQPLIKIAKDQGVPLDVIIDQVTQALTQLKPAP
jgi:hypothetical protein